MIEISYREFQRGFCKLKDGNEEIRVVGKGGVVVGIWTPGSVEMADGREENDEEEDEEKFPDSHKKELSDKVHTDLSDTMDEDEAEAKASQESRPPIMSDAALDLMNKFDYRHKMSDNYNSGQKLEEKPEDFEIVTSNPCFGCGAEADSVFMNEEASGYEERLCCEGCRKKRKITNYKKI